MRIVRRVALIGSVLLIIAGAVGVAARRGDVVRERDLELQGAAGATAQELAATVVTSQVAAATASDPAAVADALVSLPDDARWCVVDADVGEPLCGGSAVSPSQGSMGEAVLARRGTVAVVGGALVVVTVGTHVVVGIERAATAADVTESDDVALALVERAPTPGPALRTLDGSRIARADVVGTDAMVTAATDASIPVTGDGWVFLGLVLTLALALLVLAAATLRAERRILVERASIDPLTQLPNRGEFERRAEELLGEAHRAGSGACMLLFDLDGFKLINDTHGHQAGDEVLRTIGSRLRRSVRDTDVVARWGGDEFVLLLRGIEDASAARTRAADLAQLIAGEVIGDGLRVGASVGIAMFPRHGAELAELVEAADGAMYAAKRDGVTSRLAGVESAPVVMGQADRRQRALR
jgi:diguanylate cyclase (GGDEF)-like protein